MRRQLRPWLAALSALWLIGTAVPARAAAETEMLEKALDLIGLNPKEITVFALLCNNVKDILAKSNDMVSLARQSRAAVEYVRSYSSDDLDNRAQQDLFAMFPEGREITREAAITARNVSALAGNDGTFFKLRDYHDNRMRMRVLHAYKATMWPDRNGNRTGLGGTSQREPTPVDVLVQKRFDETGTAFERGLRDSQLAKLQEEVERLREEAKRRDDISVQSAAISAQAGVQVTHDTAELLDLERQKVAIEEQRRSLKLGVDRSLLAIIADNPSMLFTMESLQ